MKIEIEAKDSLKKEVSNGGTSGRIFVPKEWKGKKVLVALLEEVE